MRDISAFPGEKDYDEGNRVFNQAYADNRPSFIAFPRNDEDVQRCLRCSLGHSVPCVVKSGGHSSAGYSTINASDGSAFVINLARMKQVTVSNDTVQVQAGARWANVYDELKNSSWLVTGGECPVVGVSGYILGGGYSVLSRKYGLCIDNLISATMVTADGARVVVANDTANPDLFWALRGGGGGNFGIVTEFTLQLHPSAYTNYVFGSMTFEPGLKSQQALAKYGLHLPNELFLLVSITSNKKLSILPVYLGGYDEVIKVLTPITDLASEVRLINYTSYYSLLQDLAAENHLSSNSSDKPQLLSGCILSTVDDTVAEIVFAMDIPKGCNIYFTHLGGVVQDKSPEETAYFFRHGHCDYYVTCNYDNKEEEAKMRSFIDRLRDVLLQRGYCIGSYVNDMDRGLQNWQQKYYGGNYEHLLRIKNKWNPVGSGYFHFPQEIGSKYKFDL